MNGETPSYQPDDELPCGCGFLWSQFIDAGIDELVNYCPCCGVAVK